MSRNHHRQPGRPERPTPAHVRALKSEGQKAYVASDPRWVEHRRKLAAAQIARRFTLSEAELIVIIEHRRKGRSLSYIAEDIGIDREVLAREMRAHDLSTAPIRQRRRVVRSKGLWRSFEEVPALAPKEVA